MTGNSLDAASAIGQSPSSMVQWIDKPNDEVEDWGDLHYDKDSMAEWNKQRVEVEEGFALWFD